MQLIEGITTGVLGVRMSLQTELETVLSTLNTARDTLKSTSLQDVDSTNTLPVIQDIITCAKGLAGAIQSASDVS